MLDWTALMNPRRFGDDRPEQDPDRTPFERDQDRIIYETAFRRLAGKTQVFPLPQSDVTHNRLTHTLEVATVGRSLGRLVASKSPAWTAQTGSSLSPADVGAVTAAACLAHDIGNPPFGHNGEAAIAEYFINGAGRDFIKDLAAEQAADFQQFEGNALGFRILTKTNPQKMDTPGGLRLTYATLGAFLKYPKLSTHSANGGDSGVSHKTPASEKKFCAFYDDRQNLINVANTLQLEPKRGGGAKGWHRHALAFVVEAADDICNRIIDLEDAFRADLISEAQAAAPLHQVVEDVENVKSRLSGISDPKARIGYLRARAIGILLIQAAARFNENEDGIAIGTFDEPLVTSIPARAALAEMEDLMRDFVYRNRQVVEVEAAGFDVLSGLLDAFLVALLKEPNSKRAKTLIALTPKHAFDPHAQQQQGKYETILDVVSYVAGMTDSYAIDFYRTIRGIELPNY